MTSMRLRLVFSFSFGDLLLLGCFPLCVCVCVSHFASVFAVFLPSLDVLHMPASTCNLSLNSVRGFGAGGYDVHATATCVFFFFW